MTQGRTIAKTRLEADRGAEVVFLGLNKVQYILNLPRDWSVSLGFNPRQGSGSMMHVPFCPLYSLLSLKKNRAA